MCILSNFSTVCVPYMCTELIEFQHKLMCIYPFEIFSTVCVCVCFIMCAEPSFSAFQLMCYILCVSQLLIVVH